MWYNHSFFEAGLKKPSALAIAKKLSSKSEAHLENGVCFISRASPATDVAAGTTRGAALSRLDWHFNERERPSACIDCRERESDEEKEPKRTKEIERPERR